MILVFGGTTEGRQAVKTLEEAGSPFYYSTRSDGQQVELLHGVRLEGELDLQGMTAFCRAHGIRLIVDAAHPFAQQLHRNLLLAAGQMQLPLVRYDRIYPPRTAEAVWCRDYDDAASRLEARGIGRLLALTGVNTIGRLKPYWQRHPDCWFRILDRQASRHIAQASGFPEERLVYYETDETTELISRLAPQAIITKESGLSGGFSEKVAAARAAGIEVFVVERPAYPPETPGTQPPQIATVNGPNGLRRAVEKLLPEFYPLHSGLTTGTCATAAAIAATLRLLAAGALDGWEAEPAPTLPRRQDTPQGATLGGLPAEVPVVLPDGETIMVAVGYGDGYAQVVKDAGDDPDVTNGLEVRATVELAAGADGASTADRQAPLPPTDAPDGGICICGGEGVGTFTLPGFDFPPGEAAINKGPRAMIRQNLRRITTAPLRVTIAVPRGRATASRTFNPRLGIEGGISIIGVSGIVKPFSEQAFIESIRKCMEVAKASGASRVVINSGAKSERFLKARYPDLPRQAFVEYGNYIGQTLGIAHQLGIGSVTLGVMLGKAVKLAAGHLDTHSRRATMDKAFIAQMLRQAGCPDVDLGSVTLARELWQRVPPSRLQALASVVIGHCMAHCRPLLPDGQLSIMLIDDDGHIYTAGP